MKTNFHSPKCVCIDPPNQEGRTFKIVTEEIIGLINSDYSLSYSYIRSYLSVSSQWMSNVRDSVYHIYTSASLEQMIESQNPAHLLLFKNRYHFALNSFYEYILSSPSTRETIQIDLYPFMTRMGLSRALKQSLSMIPEDIHSNSSSTVMIRAMVADSDKKSHPILADDLSETGKLILKNTFNHFDFNNRRDVHPEPYELEKYPTELLSIKILKERMKVSSYESVYRYLFRVGAIKCTLSNSIVRYVIPKYPTMILPVTISYAYYLLLKKHSLL